MSGVFAPADVKGLIVASLHEPIVRAGLDPGAIPDGLDLRIEGIVDSFGFVQLIADLEARLGSEIDIEALEPEQLTVVGALSRHIAAGLARQRPGAGRE